MIKDEETRLKSSIKQLYAVIKFLGGVGYSKVYKEDVANIAAFKEVKTLKKKEKKLKGIVEKNINDRIAAHVK